MSHWQSCTIGDQITLQRGFDITQKEASPGNVPIISSGGVSGWHNEAKVNGPGVVIGRKGSLGTVHFSDGPYWPHDTTLWVKDFKGNNRRFVFYFLKTIDTKNLDVGSSNPTLNRNHVHPVETRWPERRIQDQIVAILGALDNKIELNRRTSTTLEEMARTLYRSWFIDFDPMHAKMEGRLPLFMNEATAALFPDSFGPDGLPKGWKRVSVNDVFDVVMGQSPPGNTYNDIGNGLPFFQGRTDFGFRYPENRKFCSAPSRVAGPESVLLSVRAPVGDVNRAWEKCCIGRGVSSLSEKNGRTSFGYYTMWSLAEKLLVYDSEGTVFGAINKKQLLSLPVVAAPDELRSAYDVVAAPIDARIRNLTSENRVLSALRDTLLPRLMSGDLRLGEAREQIEEVA